MRKRSGHIVNVGAEGIGEEHGEVAAKTLLKPII